MPAQVSRDVTDAQTSIRSAEQEKRGALASLICAAKYWAARMITLPVVPGT